MTGEWRWAIGWSVVIVLLSCAPYILAGLLTPEGWQFAGILVNPLDGHSYLAKMRQGYEGNWLFHLTYTPEPHEGAFIFIFYLTLGRLASWLHLPLIWMFHLARLLGGLFLLLIAFRFITRITPQAGERRLAFVLLMTASGLGWLGSIFGAFPIDLWIPEAFVPYSIYAVPHFALAMGLMLVIFLEVGWPRESEPNGRAEDEEPPSLSEHQSSSSNLYPLFSILRPGLAALILALILPFALLTVWAVLLVFLGWLFLVKRKLPWPQVWAAFGAIAFSAPVIFYDYRVSITNPTLAGWSSQNVTAAPGVLDLLLGYGLVGLLAVLGSWFIIRREERPLQKHGEWLVLIWAATTLVLMYLPFELQRRLINGLHIPLVILAAIGLKRWLAGRRWLKVKHRRFITTAVVTLGALGTLFVWVVPLLAVWQAPPPAETTVLLFLREEEIVAFDWLEAQAGMENVILSSPRIGMFVPGQTGARAFYGHPFETIDAETKQDMVTAFYQGEIKAVTPPVDFVIYGPSEQTLGQPAHLSELPVLFSTGEVTVYGPE